MRGCYDAHIDTDPHAVPEPASPTPAVAPRLRPAEVMLWLGLAVVFVLHARAWSFLCDDAFISFRYAEHLAAFGDPSFNVGVDPPERVEGYTNFAWVVVLAAGSVVGVRPHLLAPWLTLLASGAGLVLAVALLRALRPTDAGPWRALALLPAAVLIALPEYMVWSGSGLETAAAMAAVLASMLAWMRARWFAAGALAALAGLTRMDALLPIAVFGLSWLAVVAAPRYWKERADTWQHVPWKTLGLAGLAFAGPLFAHLLWRRAYYGAWVPNTWPIKAHGMLLRDTYGDAYVQSWIEHMHLVWWSPLLVGARPRHLLLAFPVSAVVAYGWWVGGDFMAYSRFYLVATTLFAVLVSWVALDALGAVRARLSAPRRPLACWALVALGVGVVGMLGRDARARHTADVERGGRWLDKRWEGVTAMDQFAKVGFAAGSWMGEHLPADTWITVGAAGAVPYGAGLPTIDAYGLVDPVIATMPEAGPYTGKGARPGHQLQAPRKYIRSRDPDLLCHVGFRGTKPPPRARRPRGYGRGYAWACIDLDPISDARAPGGELPAGVYCCRRPTDRVVGPFGAAP